MPSIGSANAPRRLLLAAATLVALAAPVRAGAPLPTGAAEEFHRDIEPILAAYCYDCHGNGAQEGSVTLDAFASDDAVFANRDLWWRALKMLRADMMPPVEAEQPSDAQIATLERWIKSGVFRVDPANPDPGRVTVRRLNRTEYKNTIRDLMGVDFDVQTEFPPDDTGYGFDNIGDVLTVSPLLLEKYIAAAEKIVGEAVPTVSAVIEERRIDGDEFRRTKGENKSEVTLSYYAPAEIETKLRIKNPGQYELWFDVWAGETWVNDESDLNRCRVTCHLDGEELWSREFARADDKTIRMDAARDLSDGEHTLIVRVEPLTPDAKRVRSLRLEVKGVTLRGPVDAEHRVKPPNYDKFFPRDVPVTADGRRSYATELLGKFATKAFRRRVDQATAERLAALAESVYTQPGQTFEAGVAQAMAAVLASPRFLFREEAVETENGRTFPLVDEYALATRLSYFLWSTMPDDELMQLARDHKLRENLDAQIERMMGDQRFEQFLTQFSGQWLRSRDVETWPVDARGVLSRENPDADRDRLRRRFRRLQRKDPEKMTDEEKAELREVREQFFKRFEEFRRAELSGDLRRAMRRETEMLFAHIVREDLSMLDLIDADYAFLNERLAKQYGIDGVEGDRMQRVELPDDSPRGGVLTQGTTLVVTSNPDRTSPAKRGLYVLENILGTPPPPPPPNIPSLEQAEAEMHGKTPTARELLERHRADPLCMACHNRMDPLGLGLENFNALGVWRDQERKQPIDSTGELITGETFTNIRELKKTLATTRRGDFYRCATEKLLTYALGRGLEYNDVEAVDRIVAALEANDGRASALLLGVIKSEPFQRTRLPEAAP